MAAFQRMIAPSNSTDALYRTWAKQAYDDFLACGQVLTGDTGQVDWSRVRSFTNGAITTGTANFQSANGAFTQADRFQGIRIPGAGSGGADLKTTILTVTDANNVVLATNALTTVAAATTQIGPWAPGTNTAGSFYNIFAFNDALAATFGVVYKVWWSTGNSANDTGVFVQVGSSSDGAGNITGQKMAASRQVAVNSSNSTSTFPWLISGSTNRIQIWAETGTNTNWGFSIERDHDAAGADLATNILWLSSEMTSAKIAQRIPSTGLVPAAVTGVNCLTPVGATSGAYTGNFGTFPIFHNNGGQFLNPGLNWIVYFQPDSAKDSQDNIPGYGANHNYYYTGQGTAGWGLGGSGTTNIAVRFE